MKWLERWKRIRATKKLAKRMLELNEQQRIENGGKEIKIER